MHIEHAYELTRVETESGTIETLVTGVSTIACVDRTGKVRRLPDFLRES